jgi:hypothetical protein
MKKLLLFIVLKKHFTTSNFGYFGEKLKALQLQITNYKLQITNYKLQITNYKLQITNYKLQITNCFAQYYFLFNGAMKSAFFRRLKKSKILATFRNIKIS